MQIPWQELLFSDNFQGQDNKPFERFLSNVTRVATVGHNERSAQAHKKALEDLAANHWQRCGGFTLDERLANETVAIKLSRLPGVAVEQKAELLRLSRQFALRCQLKSFVKDIYIERLQTHYQQSHGQSIDGQSVNVDWQWLLYHPAEQGKNKTLLSACDAIAHRIFWNEEIARQATDAVIKKMMANQWEKLAGFQGRGSAEGYFKKVFHTQAQDFFKAMYGSCQPKTWIRNAGQVMVKLFKKLCCEKLSATVLSEHYESLRHELLAANTMDTLAPMQEQELSKDKIDACVRLILQKEVNCLRPKVEEISDTSLRHDDEGDGPVDRGNSDDNESGGSFEDKASVADWDGTLLAMQILIGQVTLDEAMTQLQSRLDDQSRPHFESVKRLRQLLLRLDQSTLAKLQLSEAEKLTMQYRYIHGLTLKDTAKQMSQNLHKEIKQHQVVYSEKNAFQKLHQLLFAETTAGQKQK